ncbi:Fe-S cluster assembly protein HesB [Nocardioides sp. WS12]|uniref:Fe-S cluster assembly protein HesB n=1 Tax=Nocardioides sp. WS12 TaxID=2486272 RepID=UPI0015F7CC05|nr:Fe-S cluster assembly protein HesB [Nocardioides sp. WS12]
MLTLTENACTIVKQMTEVSAVPDTAGLRITAADTGFTVMASNEPDTGDRIVEQDGATVFLDPKAADQLDAMVLDAGRDDTGAVQFGLVAQA